MNMFLADNPVWVTALVNAVTNIINPILILVATAGIIYAIVVGVKFAKAEDKGARDEAKQKLITVIIGIVVTAVLILLFIWLRTAIQNETISIDNWFGTGKSE
jgi:cytochrome c biogenesis protein CcdA